MLEGMPDQKRLGSQPEVLWPIGFSFLDHFSGKCFFFGLQLKGVNAPYLRA